MLFMLGTVWNDMLFVHFPGVRQHSLRSTEICCGNMGTTGAYVNDCVTEIDLSLFVNE